MKRVTVLAGLLLMLVVLAGCWKETPPQQPASKPAPKTKAKKPEPTDFGAVTLFDLYDRGVRPLNGTGKKANVFLFVRTDCPISNRYAPEVRRLHQTFSERGVAFWLIFPDPDETPKTIREYLKEFDYPCGALRDPRHAMVRATQAEITPEAAVFDAEQALVYCGRIDDRFVAFGKERATATTRDLRNVLEAVLAGKAVEFSRTKAVGCFIADLK